MKVVIDTNVLVSAVLKDRDPEEVMYITFPAGHYPVVTLFFHIPLTAADDFR